MHIYNTAEVLALLRSIVEEKGADYVYKPQEGSHPDSPVCRYFNEDGPTRARDEYGQWGTPECIVGHVLKRIGVHGVPSMCEGVVPTEPAEFMTSTWEWWTSKFTVNALHVLRAAQAEQDRMQPWGKALMAAELRAVRYP